MNEIFLCNTTLPLVSACDYLAAAEHFYHADRIADFHVMIYVTEGCIYVTEDNVDYEIHAGELFFLKSGVRHFGKLETKRGTCWHFVHFYMEKFSEASSAHGVCHPFQGNPNFLPVNRSLNRPLFDTQLHPAPDTCPQPLYLMLPKKLTDLADTDLAKHIAEFTEYFHSGDAMRQWNRNQQFFQLLTEIACYQKQPKAPLRLSDRIAKYLAAHFEEPFSAAALEQHFFLSYKHMAAVFKKEKQQTMQQFHTMVRMNTACKLLRSTLLPIGEISRRAGYSDMLYFSRCFHAVMGMSPSEYRKQPPRY